MKRQVGSLLPGRMPTIIRRDSKPCVTAMEMTAVSNWPKDIRHFTASGRSQLLSSSKSSDKSLGCTL